NSVALYRARLEIGRPKSVKSLAHVLERHGVRHIPLVVLENDGKFLDLVLVRAKIFYKVDHREKIIAHSLRTGISDINDPVDSVEDNLAAHGINILAGNGVEIEFWSKTFNLSDLELHEVKKYRPILFGFQIEDVAPKGRVDM